MISPTRIAKPYQMTLALPSHIPICIQATFQSLQSHYAYSYGHNHPFVFVFGLEHVYMCSTGWRLPAPETAAQSAIRQGLSDYQSLRCRATKWLMDPSGDGWVLALA